jgi:peptidoglycan/xylan/chitin deacetylase (PgdA/CDA1 family)
MSYLSSDELSRRRRAAEARRARRRRWIVGGLLVAVAAAVAAVLVTSASGSRHTPAQPKAATTLAQVTPPTHRPKPRLKPVRVVPARPGVARVYLQGPPKREIALTFDDGFCASCVARIIHTLARTGAHATIFPNGRYASSWDPVAPTIRKLVALGQLTIGNHTFLHLDAREESADGFGNDLQNDEVWIEHTFGVSARPFFRPPYGAYDSGTLLVAGAAGYTKVIMWSGTVADSSPRTIEYILEAIRHWAKPGAIILMHGNYPATSLALPQIISSLHARGLRPVTLAELLG